MSARHVMLDCQALNRRAHVWCFGEVGRPLIVFPSNAGVAHEWRESGMIDALAPLLARAQVKIYCPESNVSQTFSGSGGLDGRMHRHHLYERFVLETLLPFVRRDCRSEDARPVVTGCSLGALYAALFALKHPEHFSSALCMSGRYRVSGLIGGGYSDDVYFNDPLAFVPGLEGRALDRVRGTHLTLVVGTGAFEGACVPETLELGAWLKRKGIPHHLGVWGSASRHDYPWWRKQAAHYVPQLL